jgi:hypothetical protein
MLIFTVQLTAQDIITLKNNYTIDAKNIVVTPKEVKYQDYYDNSGEMLILQKNKVASISYINGSTISLYEIKKTKTQVDIGRNLITFHFLDFAINNFTFSYERIISEGKYSIQIPFSFGYSDETTSIPLPPPFYSDYTNDLVNKFYTGITFNIYPTRQGKFKYFLGPSVQFGSGVFHENTNQYGQYNPPPIKTGYFKFLINNGIVATFAKSFSISLVGSIGIQHMYKINTNSTQTTGALSLNLSYRF